MGSEGRSKGEDEYEDEAEGADPFPTSLKLLFDLNGLVFFAAGAGGGCKGLPVSFWIGTERSTSGCRPRPAWSSVLIAPAFGVREWAVCGMLEKLGVLGTLRADGAGEAERAPDIAEPGRRGGRRADKGISSSLLSDDSLSLVSVSTMTPLSLGRVGGINDPREKEDGRLVPGVTARDNRARVNEKRIKVRTFVMPRWIAEQLTTMPQLTLTCTGPLLLLTRSPRVPMPEFRLRFPVSTGTRALASCGPHRGPSTNPNLIYSALCARCLFPPASVNLRLRDSCIPLLVILARRLIL